MRVKKPGLIFTSFERVFYPPVCGTTWLMVPVRGFQGLLLKSDFREAWFGTEKEFPGVTPCWCGGDPPWCTPG